MLRIRRSVAEPAAARQANSLGEALQRQQRSVDAGERTQRQSAIEAHTREDGRARGMSHCVRRDDAERAAQDFQQAGHRRGNAGQ